MHAVAEAVKTELQGYADRGIFSNFTVSESSRSEELEFRFNWLAEAPFLLRLKTHKQELELKDILPSVPFRSSMDQEFRNFLKARSSESIPGHRRMDDSRFNFRCQNRKQKLSVLIGFDDQDAAAAARTSVNLLHEIFNNFLMEGPYQNYMVEVFNVPEE